MHNIIRKLSIEVMKCVSCVTEREAACIGIFFRYFLELLTTWTEKFQSECANTASFKDLDQNKFRYDIMALEKSLTAILKRLLTNKPRSTLITLSKVVEHFPHYRQ
mmetsp:Transcript_17150/g.8104  ORF Transcript_17150/g.8104 Transcript_17150/m.8104 type:complete len:106 (+) Transcript_17150:197-514(+)